VTIEGLVTLVLIVSALFAIDLVLLLKLRRSGPKA
jgi:hypothetical protein